MNWKAPPAAPGWPLVCYFHHVSPYVNHYTALKPSSFRRGIEGLLEGFGPALDPSNLEDVTKCLGCETPKFLVTFDDGYKNVLDFALPILDDLGVRAVHFLISDAVANGACSGIAQPRAPFLNRKDVEVLLSHGHRVGAHTRTHRPLSGLHQDEAQVELDAEPVNTHGREELRLFAYPYGIFPKSEPRFSDRTLAFGTIKSDAYPWTVAPHAIRRNYLPAGHEADWPKLISEWRQACRLKYQ